MRATKIIKLSEPLNLPESDQTKNKKKGLVRGWGGGKTAARAMSFCFLSCSCKKSERPVRRKGNNMVLYTPDTASEWP